MKYLIKSTEVYKIDTVENVEAFHQELLDDAMFDLTAFGYKTKYDKKNDEEYQVVTATKIFNLEKEPDRKIDIHYEVVG